MSTGGRGRGSPMSARTRQDAPTSPDHSQRQPSWFGSASGSEQPVLVSRVLRDYLQHVPMLDDLPVFVEAEDVDPCIVLAAWPSLMAVQDDVLALSDGADELHVLAGILSRHALEVVDERLLAIADVRVVLDVRVARVHLEGLRGLALVEHEVVERLDVPLVGVQPRRASHARKNRWASGPIPAGRTWEQQSADVLSVCTPDAPLYGNRTGGFGGRLTAQHHEVDRAASATAALLRHSVARLQTQLLDAPEVMRQQSVQQEALVGCQRTS